MKKGHIRLMDSKDCHQVSEIYKYYVEHTPISFEETPPDEHEILKRLNEVMKKHIWLVFEQESDILGYAYTSSYRQRKAYQWIVESSVYVRNDMFRRGIAAKLYHSLHHISEKQGYLKSYAGMAVPNEASRKFHLAMGYKPLAFFNKIGFKLGQWHSTEWFEKQLGKSSSIPSTPISIDKFKKVELENILKNLRC